LTLKLIIIVPLKSVSHLQEYSSPRILNSRNVTSALGVGTNTSEKNSKSGYLSRCLNLLACD